LLLPRRQRRGPRGDLLVADEPRQRQPRARGPGPHGGPDRALLALDPPARGRALLPRGSIAADELLERILVDYLGAQLLRLRQLRAGAVPGDHVVGLLRDRVHHLAARQPDQARGLLATQARQGAGEDECLAVERAALLAALRRVQLHPQAGPAEPLDQLPGAVLGEL